MMNPIAYGMRAFFLIFMSLILLMFVLLVWERNIGLIAFWSILSLAFVAITYLFRKQILRQNVSKVGVTMFLTNAALVVSVISTIAPWAKLFLDA